MDNIMLLTTVLVLGAVAFFAIFVLVMALLAMD